MATGQRKLRAYLYRCGLTDNTMCPCEEEQTTDHLILSKQRKEMIKPMQNTGDTWLPTHET